MRSLEGRHVVVGVTGGIAAYKACEVVRELRKLGAAVRVTLTEAAQHFVTPLTFATLSEHPVLSTLFAEDAGTGTIHIEWARWADAILLCPATANIIGKVATGIADDALTTLILATRAPVIVCPAMNAAMWDNPVVQSQVEKLKRWGYRFVDPEWGPMATESEGEGWGRLASTPRILNALRRQLLGTEELKGVKVVVSAGRTEEPIDPVRILTNRSSAKMGFALAAEAALRGAEVTLISGPNNLERFDGIAYQEVRTAAEMATAVKAEAKNADVVIMAAAVCDYRPKAPSQHKLKKETRTLTLELEPTEDILQSLGMEKGDRLLVGFAVETQDILRNARAKLQQKNLDLIVVNNPLEEGVAFGADTNKVTLIHRDGSVEALPKMPKPEVAQRVLEKIVALRKAVEGR